MGQRRRRPDRRDSIETDLGELVDDGTIDVLDLVGLVSEADGSLVRAAMATYR